MLLLKVTESKNITNNIFSFLQVMNYFFQCAKKKIKKYEAKDLQERNHDTTKIIIYELTFTP